MIFAFCRVSYQTEVSFRKSLHSFVTVSCWSVRMPDSHQVDLPKPYEIMLGELEPRDDFGVVRIKTESQKPGEGKTS